MAPSDKAQSNSYKQFAYRVLLGTSIVLGLILLLIGLWYAVQVLLITFAGVLLAIVLRFFARWVGKYTNLSHDWSIGVVILLLLMFLGSIGTLVAPQVGSQLSELRTQLPAATQELKTWLQEYGWGNWLLNEAFALQDIGRQLQNGLREAFGVAYTLVQVVSGVFILLFVAFYLSINPKMYINGILHMVSFKQRERAAQVLGVTGYTLHWWLLGAFIHMAVVGIMTFIGLWLLNIPLAFLLALVAFLLDFVPYFGPIIASIPAILLGFTVGPEQALYVLLLYVAVQQIEGLIIDPLIYHRTVYLPPVLTVLSQILLYTMAGALGVILATPLMAVFFVLVKLLYVKQVLGDNQVGELEKAAELDGYIPPIPKKT